MSAKTELEQMLAQMESSPGFAGLSFEEQQKARETVIGNVLLKDPGYSMLDPYSQQVANDQIASSRRPVFENQRLTQYIAPVFENAEQGRMTGAQMNIFSFNRGFVGNSVSASAISLGWTHLADAVLKNINPAWATNTLNIEAVTGSDGDKVIQYLRERVGRYNEGAAKRAGTWETAGSVLGFAGDFALFHGGWEKLAGKGIAAITARYAAQTKGALSTAIKVALPSFASGTSSGLYGIFREHFLGLVNKDDERLQNSFDRMLKTFGEYALLDYAINIALGSMIPAITTFRHLFARGQTSKLLTAFSPEQLDDIIAKAANGQPPMELLEQMPDANRFYLLGQADLRRAAGNVSSNMRLSPYDDLLLEASDARMTVYNDPSSGIFHLFKNTSETSGVMMEVPDMIAARRVVSGELAERLTKLQGDEYASFIDRHANMLAYSSMENAIDGSFDPRKVRGNPDPDTTRLVRFPGRQAGFTSPVDRPYIGRNEAEMYMKAFNENGFARVFRTSVPEESLQRVGKEGRLFNSALPVKVANEAEGSELFVLLRNPADAKAISKANQLAKKAIDRGATEGQDILRTMYLMEGGYDGVVLTRDSVQVFYPDKLKLIADTFDPATGRVVKVKDIAAADDAIGLRGTILRKYKATLRGRAVAANDEVITQVASTFKGDLKQDDVRKLSQIVLGEYGVSPDMVDVRVSKAVNSIDRASDVMAYASIDAATKKAVIEIPGSITTPKAQKQFIEELFDEIKNVGDTLGSGIKKAGAQYAELFSRSSAKFVSPFSDAISTEKWLKSAVEDSMDGVFTKTARGYEIKLPGNRQLFANNLDELTDRLFVESLDESYIKMDLNNQGYRMSKVGDRYVIRGPELPEPITGTTIPEVLDNLGYRPSKISNRFAPKIAAINSDSIDVVFENGSIIGNKRAIKKTLARFEDYDYMARLRRISTSDKGDVFVHSSGSYELRMPELGLIKKFHSSGEATRFMHKTWSDFDSIKEMAHAKGLEFWYEGGSMRLSDGTTTFVAKNQEELSKVFREYPDSTGAREIFEAYDPEVLTPIDRVLQDFDITDLDSAADRVLKTAPETGASMNVRQEVRALIENMDYWAEKTLTEMNNPVLLRKYRSLETSRSIAQTEIDATDKALMGIFSDEHGKLLPVDRRRAIFYHMGAQSPAEQQAAFETFGALSDNELVIAGNLRKLLGTKEGNVLTGLAGKFGIDSERFIFNYMPRIMDYSAKNAKALAEMASAQELFEAALKNVSDTNAPKKLSSFFKNLRASEMLSFNAVDDPLQSLMHYNRIGHRELYMGRAWSDLYKELSDSHASAGIVSRFNRYREGLMGISITEGQKTAERIGEAFGMKLKINSGKDLVNGYFSVNYLANMGWRPWLAVRNTFQIWTTLAPRFGNYWTDKAVGHLAELGEDSYEYLRKIGVIQDAPPVVNEIMSSERWLGKIVHKGLAMFKNSDDITRAVSYYVGELRFNDALLKMSNGTLKNIDEFLKEAGVTKMDGDTVSEVRRLMQKGTDEAIAAARTKFGMKISEDSMFAYRSSQAPSLYTGSFFGKLFGQYGTYSAGYRATIYRGLQYGSAGDRAAFVARFLGNQLALYGTFTLLGIRAKDFFPGNPALFGGGPQFEVATAVLTAFSTDYRGQQARAKLQRYFSPINVTGLFEGNPAIKANYPEMLPGSLQYRYLKKAYEYLESGDTWRAFLALTTTPVVDPDDMPNWTQQIFQ